MGPKSTDTGNNGVIREVSTQEMMFKLSSKEVNTRKDRIKVLRAAIGMVQHVLETEMTTKTKWRWNTGYKEKSAESR